MRRIAATVLLLTACGGGDSGPASPPPPPPPPPPPGAPAAIQVLSGDGQTAEPGTALPTAPAVVVRDAANRAVPNVAVSFAVDSGGGRLATTTATTGADGTAALGGWTLGPAEGRNVVSATVSGAAPVRVVANARYRVAPIGTLQLPDGGALTVSAGPLTGLRIEMPVGAFGGTVAIDVGAASAFGTPHDTLVRVASPAVVLTSQQTEAALRPGTITMPARLAADEFPVVAFVDTTTGVVRVLPTLRYDTAGVTASLAALAPAPSPPAAVIQAAGRSPTARLQSRITVTSILAVLAAKLSVNGFSYDVGFVPGVDDWDFAVQDTPIGPTSLGQVLSEKFYFESRKSVFGSLYQRFDRARGVGTSAAAGIYWSAGLTKVLQPLVTGQIDAAKARSAPEPEAYRRNTLYSTLLAMVLTRRTQVLFVVDADNFVRPVLAYRWDGPAGRLQHANPQFPGALDRYTQWTPGVSNCISYDCLVVAGAEDFAGLLSDQFGAVIDETMYKDLQPVTYLSTTAPVLRVDQPKAADTLFVVDDAESVWVEIPTWPHWLPATRPPQYGAPGFQDLEVYLETGGSWTTWQGGSSGAEFVIDAGALDVPPGQAIDRLIALEARAVDPPAASGRWAGFKVLRVIKFAPVVDVLPGPPGETTTLLLQNPDDAPLPANYAYRFTWNDGSLPVTYHSRPDQVTHDFPDDDERQVLVEIIHPTLDKVVGRTTVTVGNTPESPVFRMTAVDVHYGTSGPQVSSDGRWRVDSTRFDRIRARLTQAGIRLVQKPFQRFCALCREQFVAEGLYLVEGPVVSPATLANTDAGGGFASDNFAGASLQPPPDGEVNGWALVRTEPDDPGGVCMDPPYNWDRTGDAVTGRVEATYTHYCWPNPWPNNPLFSGYPNITIDADVTISNGEMEGTLVLTYIFPQSPVGPVIQKKFVEVRFRGPKVTP